jgi:hypothetical protein
MGITENNIESSPTPHVNRIFRKTNYNNIPGYILEEYSIKRAIFDPKNISPNIFLNNLERRMGAYYIYLYNSKKP